MTVPLCSDYNYRSTAIRPPFDAHSTEIRPRYDHATYLLWAAALQSKQAVGEATTICPRPL